MTASRDRSGACGPPAMVDDVSVILADLGAGAGGLVVEDWARALGVPTACG